MVTRWAHNPKLDVRFVLALQDQRTKKMKSVINIERLAEQEETLVAGYALC